MRIYLVGGAVRDRLLGLPVLERDWVVTGATPEQMQAQGFVPIDGIFPVFRHPETGDEHALARVETKHGSGHRGFSFDCSPAISLEQDLARRDLSINAIAEDRDGNLLDPYDGLTALHERRLVHITPAFADDPLRLLRTARFAALLAHLGFSIDPATLALMKQMVVDGEPASLSRERVWRELERALRSPTPRVIFDVLHECGASTVLLPSVPTPALRPDSLALRALESLTSTSTDPDLRLAAFVVAGLDRADRHEAESIARGLHAPATAIRSVSRVAAIAQALSGSEKESASRCLAAIEAGDGLRQAGSFLEALTAIDAVFCESASERLLSDSLRTAQTAAAGVKAAAFVAAGMRGATLGEALRDARLQAVQRALSG